MCGIVGDFVKKGLKLDCMLSFGLCSVFVLGLVFGMDDDLMFIVWFFVNSNFGLVFFYSIKMWLFLCNNMNNGVNEEEFECLRV